MKVSNELLSSVLGCECDFFTIQNNNVYFVCEGVPVELNSIVEYNESNCIYKVNLDTFIRIAKIWAFENGSMICESGSWVTISESKQDGYITSRNKSFHKEKREAYNQESLLKALEWCLNDSKN